MKLECDACEEEATHTVTVKIDNTEVSKRSACIDHIAHPWKLNIGKHFIEEGNTDWHQLAVFIEPIPAPNIFEPLGRLGFGEDGT